MRRLNFWRRCASRTRPAPTSLLLTFPLQQRMDATARAIDEYCKVLPLPIFVHDSESKTRDVTFLQNPFEGVASFPVLREFQSPCACGTATQDVDKVRKWKPNNWLWPYLTTNNHQVVQCPSCGICYKVTQKRQLLSLQKSRYSAISVSPTTIFWCTFWCTIGIGCLIGECSSNVIIILFIFESMKVVCWCDLLPHHRSRMQKSEIQQVVHRWNEFPANHRQLCHHRFDDNTVFHWLAHFTTLCFVRYSVLWYRTRGRSSLCHFFVDHGCVSKQIKSAVLSVWTLCTS